MTRRLNMAGRCASVARRAHSSPARRAPLSSTSPLASAGRCTDARRPRNRHPHPYPAPAIHIAGAIVNALSCVRSPTASSRSLPGPSTDSPTRCPTVNLGGWFDAPWCHRLAVAATLSIPVLLVGVGAETIAGRPAAPQLRRGVLIPLAVGWRRSRPPPLGLLLAVVNGCCSCSWCVSASAGLAGSRTRWTGLRHVLGVSGGGAPCADRAPLLFVVLITAFLAFVIWIELAVRAALVYLLSLPSFRLPSPGCSGRRRPDGRGGCSRRWPRSCSRNRRSPWAGRRPPPRWLDTADGLASGIDQIAVGLALLFLGSFSPCPSRLPAAAPSSRRRASPPFSLLQWRARYVDTRAPPWARSPGGSGLAGGAVSGRTDLMGMGSPLPFGRPARHRHHGPQRRSPAGTTVRRR